MVGAKEQDGALTEHVRAHGGEGGALAREAALEGTARHAERAGDRGQIGRRARHQLGANPRRELLLAAQLALALLARAAVGSDVRHDQGSVEERCVEDELGDRLVEANPARRECLEAARVGRLREREVDVAHDGATRERLRDVPDADHEGDEDHVSCVAEVGLLLQDERAPIADDLMPERERAGPGGHEAHGDVEGRAGRGGGHRGEAEAPVVGDLHSGPEVEPQPVLAREPPGGRDQALHGLQIDGALGVRDLGFAEAPGFEETVPVHAERRRDLRQVERVGGGDLLSFVGGRRHVARIDKRMARADLGAKSADPQPGVMTRTLTVRRLDPGDLSGVPLDWYDGDPDLSIFWDALSAVFPEGENFFVRAVRAHRDLIDDPELLARVDAFIGQEAAHGAAHRALNRSLERRIPSAKRVDRELRWVLKELAPKLFGARQRLAITCALEHFTALLAAQLLEDERHRAAIDDRLTPLWLWHAYEEVEHEDVAFDVYRAAGGNELERRAIMALTTGLFIGFMAYFYAVMAADQKRARRPTTWLRLGYFLCMKPGLTRRLVPDYLAYYRRGFHPSQKDTAPLLETWRERLFGSDGAVPLTRRAA